MATNVKNSEIMSIKKVKVVFSEFGIHTPSMTKRKKIYMVYADVQVTTQKTHLHVNVVEGFVEKKITAHTYVCEHFFVILYGDKYLFFNEAGEKTAEKTKEEVGKVISVWEDNFVSMVGTNMRQFDSNGNLVGERPFTEEETAQLKEAGLM